MPQLTQGLIVGVLIGLLLAVIVGYYLRQGQVNELTEALQQSQKRQEDLEREHELRLRDATGQLQKDYEAHLAATMERYQAQLEDQRAQLEDEYRARQSLLGEPGGDGDSTPEQRIRKQYETRLKEAAAKIQQAYEQHLQEKLLEARSLAQQEYDQRLAGAIAQHQDDMQARLTQMQCDYEAQLQMAQVSASGSVAPSSEELEFNLRREIEDQLREQHEQQLAETIEHYQNQLTQRAQELEQSYEARLQLLQTSTPTTSAIAAAEEEPAFDLADAIAAANEVAMAVRDNSGLDLSPMTTEADLPAEPVDLGAEDISTEAVLPEGVDGSLGFDEANLELEESSLEFADFSSETAPSAQFREFSEPVSPVADSDLEFGALAENFPAADAASFEMGGFTEDFSLESSSAPERGNWSDAPVSEDLGLAQEFSLEESSEPGLEEFSLEESSEPGLEEFSLEESSELGLAQEFSLEGSSDLEFEEFSLEESSDSGLAQEFSLEESSDLGFEEFSLEESSEPGLEDLAAQETPSPRFESFPSEAEFAALLEETAGFDPLAPKDPMALGTDSDTDDLDLDALLNASTSESAGDDLLDGLDDLSDLS
jgi:hypothetical protein